MGRCAVRDCGQAGKHIFPKDKYRREQWEKVIGKNNFKVTKHPRLCGAHFKESDYAQESIYTGHPLEKGCLKKGAVPSIFPWRLTSEENNGEFSNQMMGNPSPVVLNAASTSGNKVNEQNDTTNYVISNSDTGEVNVLPMPQMLCVPLQPNNIVIQADPLAFFPQDEETENGYICANCNSSIDGIRYMCVQCAHYHMCAQCDARAAHAHHYMLRVPPARMPEEVDEVVDIIKRCLVGKLKFDPEAENSNHTMSFDQPKAEPNDGNPVDLQNNDITVKEEYEEEKYQPPDEILPDQSEGSEQKPTVRTNALTDRKKRSLKPAKSNTPKLTQVTKRQKPANVTKTVQCIPITNDMLKSLGKTGKKTPVQLSQSELEELKKLIVKQSSEQNTPKNVKYKISKLKKIDISSLGDKSRIEAIKSVVSGKVGDNQPVEVEMEIEKQIIKTEIE